MKQHEPLPTQRKVALFLALGVFLVWIAAVVQYTITRRTSDPRVDSAGEVSGGSPNPSSLSPAAPSARPAPSALARQAASQAVKAYQQALQTIPARSGPVPPPVLREVSSRLPLPQVAFPWTAPKPALVVEPAPSDTPPDQASSQSSRSLRLTLPSQVFANSQAASEAAQLIARQLVEQGYRPTLVISGTGENESSEAPVNTSANPGKPRPPSPPKPTSPADAKGNTSLPSRQGNPPESSRKPASPPAPSLPQEAPSQPSPPASLPSSSPLQDLLATLRQAVAAEFRAYRALPDLQTEELAIYFSGPAYQSVLAQLQTFKATGQVLSNPGNPSFSRFQGITGAVSIEGDTATVTGREGRALHWYIPDLQSYAPHTGQRQYISYQYRLQRQEGRWKIFQRVRL